MKRIRIFLLLALGLAIMDSCDDNPCTSEKPCIKTDTVYLKDSVTDTLLVYDTLDVFDTTTINDTLMVLDTMLVSTQTLDSAVCAVMSRFFDSQHYDTITKEQILGKWELIAFFDTTTCEMETQPEEFSDSNTIIFYENDSITGVTVSNTFKGDYSLNHNMINMQTKDVTLALDPEWGWEFVKSFNRNCYFTFIGDRLIINSNRVLILIKKQD